MSAVSKTALYLSILIVLSLSAIWYIGGNKVLFEGQIEIAAAPQQVFRVLTEPDSRAAWQTQVTRVELSTARPLAPQSRYVTERTIRQHTYSTHDRILQFEQDEWLSIQTEMPPGLQTTIFRLTRKGSQTVLNYRLTEQPWGWNRLTYLFSQSPGSQRVEQELLRIKELAEVPAKRADSSGS